MEDNEFNQDVVASLLKKRGHVAVIAGNGNAALAAWEKEPFDLILMDVQMPDMDGFAATQAIRAKEKAKGDHIPIIALTAHAMKGDRERCLAAGMDAYVSKPIRAAELFEAIARLLSADVEGAKERPGPGGRPGAVLDLDTALVMVDGDWELLRRMAQSFLRQCPKLLGEVRDSILRGDAPTAENTAHKFKASVGSFGAQRAYQAALRLEELGGAGDLTGLKKLFPSSRRRSCAFRKRWPSWPARAEQARRRVNDLFVTSHQPFEGHSARGGLVCMKDRARPRRNCGRARRGSGRSWIMPPTHSFSREMTRSS